MILGVPLQRAHQQFTLKIDCCYVLAKKKKKSANVDNKLDG